MAWHYGLLILIACVCEIVVSFRIQNSGQRAEDQAQRFQSDIAGHKHLPSVEISYIAAGQDVGAEISKVTAVEESERSLASASVPSHDIDSKSFVLSVDPAALPSIQRSGPEKSGILSSDGQSISGHGALNEVLLSATVQLGDAAAFPEPERLRDNAPDSAAIEHRSPRVAEQAALGHTVFSSVASFTAGASLLEQRAAAWVSSTAAVKVNFGSRQINIGSGLRWGFGILLVGLVFVCALPCAAACCPNRRPGAEKPAQRQLGTKRIRFQEKASVRLEGLNAVLHDVASPRPGADAEENAPSSSFFLRPFTSTLSPEPLMTEADQERASQCKSSRERRDSIAAIVKIAKKLDQTVMKYPKSGRGWLVGSSAQSRYIRVQRHPEDETDEKTRKQKKEKDKQRDTEHELYLWRQGRLGWWESAAAYDNKDTPKGVVLLSKIHGVSIGKDKTTVEVQHQETYSKRILEFVFPSAGAAKAWCETFLDLLTQLHEDLADVQLCSVGNLSASSF